MRRLSVALTLLAACGCARHEFPVGVTVEETDTGPASVVPMGDGRTAAQLVRGFHAVEGGGWRWTAQQFAVSLGVPPGAASRGARLVLQLTVPEVVAARLGAVTLAAKAGDAALPPETYRAAGRYTYSREVPAAALSGETLLVQFSLDKALPAGTADARELGIVATTIALEPK